MGSGAVETILNWNKASYRRVILEDVRLHLTRNLEILFSEFAQRSHIGMQGHIPCELRLTP